MREKKNVEIGNTATTDRDLIKGKNGLDKNLGEAERFYLFALFLDVRVCLLVINSLTHSLRTLNIITMEWRARKD
jgi:hypothetical protein